MPDDMIGLNLGSRARPAQQPGPPQSVGDLQFEQAEFSKPAAGSLACAQCEMPITQTYYEMNGKTVCESCRFQISAALAGGSAAKRFIGALFLGSIAAGFGAGIYYAVREATGYEIGFVAIIVGLLVGGAVNYGSARRGGWAYQALAIFLTYTAIVSTYIPALVTGIREATAKEESALKNAASSPDSPGPATTQPAATSSETAADSSEPPSLLGIAAGLGFLVALLYAAPFLGGFDNIMGLVIIGIGLYEAWKMNRRTNTEISGPFSVSARASATTPGA